MIKADYIWKRMKKCLKGLQDQDEYNAKKNQLKELKKLAASNYIDLYFADESGFNREGYIPYCWQEKGTNMTIVPSKTKSTQIFGLLSITNKLEAYSSSSVIDSKLVISFLDDFCERITKKTIVVLDNAPVHRSKLFEQNRKRWAEEDLEIFFLPRYSPNLNPIEILWRKMKYEWIDYTEIETQEELESQIEKIIKQYGKEYVINFE